MIPKELYEVLKELGTVYIVGGAARNLYYLIDKEPKDIDILIEQIHNCPEQSKEVWDHIFNKYEHIVNSVGGVKLFINNKEYDIWQSTINSFLSNVFYAGDAIGYNYDKNFFVYRDAFLKQKADTKLNGILKYSSKDRILKHEESLKEFEVLRSKK